MSLNFRKSWTEFKALIDAGQLQWQYEENSERYALYGAQGQFTYITEVVKDGGATQTTFEASYKAHATSVIKDGSFITDYSTPDQRLKIALSPPAPPAGQTAVNVSAVDLVSGTSFSDTVYVIPNGKTLTIQSFSGGAEASTGNSDGASKVELWSDPNGNGTGMTLIRVAYAANSNFDFVLNRVFVGDGTAAIRLRRTRLDSGNREVAAFWDGYRTP